MDDSASARDGSRRVGHRSRRHRSGITAASGSRSNRSTAATVVASVAAVVAALLLAALVAAEQVEQAAAFLAAALLAARLFAAASRFTSASRFATATLVAVVVATASRFATTSSFSTASRFATAGCFAAGVAAFLVAVEQAFESAEQIASTTLLAATIVAASVAGVVARTGILAGVLSAASVFCGTTGFFAALRLAAAVAAAVADAEHTVEQLEPIALANQAHAKHERSKNQFQFHRATSPFRVEPASCAHPQDSWKNRLSSLGWACPTRQAGPLRSRRARKVGTGSSQPRVGGFENAVHTVYCVRTVEPFLDSKTDPVA